jgi:hypothetical protein
MRHVNFKQFPSTAINIRSNFDGRKNKIIRAKKLTHTSKKIDTHEVFFGQPVTVFMTFAMYKVEHPPIYIYKANFCWKKIYYPLQSLENYEVISGKYVLAVETCGKRRNGIHAILLSSLYRNSLQKWGSQLQFYRHVSSSSSSFFLEKKTLHRLL